jgi:hypothetical protein
MAQASVVVPRDIWEDVDGNKVLVARRGERISLEEAMKHKILPIASSSIGGLEIK